MKTHEIYKSFDCNPLADMTRIFLDILKDFGKVWHEHLMFILKSYGTDGDLWITYLEDHKQRVALNGQASYWKKN